MEPLISAAPGADAARWRAAAAGVLRRVGRMGPDDPDELALDELSTTTVEGVRIPALGVAAEGTGPLVPTPIRPTGWDLRALVAEPDPILAAADLSDELAGGATSIWLLVGPAGTDPADVPELLRGLPAGTPIVLEPDGEMNLAGLLTGMAGAAAGSSLGCDPLSRSLRGHTDSTDLVEIARRAADLGVGAVCIDGTAAHEAGAGDAAEVGYTLAVGLAYVRAWESAGIDVVTALSLLEFRYAGTDEQFVTMAKLRAARVLWARIGQLCGAPEVVQRQHAVNSRLMLSRFDAWTNLLRSTVFACAAGLGGADAVTVLPHDSALGRPSATGRRLARNIQRVVLDEGHLGAVSDPAAGAYALDLLTTRIADAAWLQLQRIESGGGAVQSMADGSLRQRFSATDAVVRARIANGEKVLSGITEHTRPDELLPDRPPHPAGSRFAEIRRWAADIEDRWAGVPA